MFPFTSISPGQEVGSHGNPGATKNIPLRDKDPARGGLCIPLPNTGPNMNRTQGSVAHIDLD